MLRGETRMKVFNSSIERSWFLLLTFFLLNACGGGGGGGSDNIVSNAVSTSTPVITQTNSVPSVSVGVDQSVIEGEIVQIVAAADDPDGDLLSYLWVQLSGMSVTLGNVSQSHMSFFAPHLEGKTSENLTFQLTVSDNKGGVSTDDVIVTINKATEISLSGYARYELPTFNSDCEGLDFTNMSVKPIRNATIEIIDADSTTLLSSATTDEFGLYTVKIPVEINIFVRVRAELKKNDTTSWDVEIRDNTVEIDKPINQRPLYFLDSDIINIQRQNVIQNLLAKTGWDVSSYTAPRSAAPFAVLDTIYAMMTFLASVDSSITYPPLDIFWSTDNTTEEGNIDQGGIETSYFSYEDNHIFLLGKEGVDTDEFDKHVVAHEWFHYFVGNLSRDDSWGGSHGLFELLDMRLAFSEGAATAFAAMALNDPIYCDTYWFGDEITGGKFNIETDTSGPNPGWYSEDSITLMLYDLWDIGTDGVDYGSIGFNQMYKVLTDHKVNLAAYSSVFSFFDALKEQDGVDTALVDLLLDKENINYQDINMYGIGETNDGEPGKTTDVLPVYTEIFIGNPIQICSNSQYDPDRDGNKLSETRFLKFTLDQEVGLDFVVTTVDPSSTPSEGYNCQTAAAPEIYKHSDPDFYVDKNGVNVITAESCQANIEQIQDKILPVGDYVMEIAEWRFSDTETREDFPARSCFDVSITL